MSVWNEPYQAHKGLQLLLARFNGLACKSAPGKADSGE